MPKQKFCVSFSGPRGSSKSPIAHYLSQKCNLIIFNNDTFRTEVIEDMGYLDQNEYTKRRNGRTEQFLKTGQSFICDASVDRTWNEFSQILTDYGYQWFIISLDLSKKFLIS